MSRWPAVAGVVLLAMLPSAVPAQDCAALYDAAQAAREVGDLEALRAVHAEALRDPSCDPDFRRSLGAVVAGAVIRAAQARAQAVDDLQAAEPLLIDSLVYARKWQALAVLGDIADARRDHEAAARRYQEALQAIDDPTLTPDAPDAQVIAGLFDRAQRAALLSERYVAPPRTRSGSPAGLTAPRIRGFTVARVALPITFRFDAAEFDSKGQAAVADLSDGLKAEGDPDIVLIGHTDPRGADDYNMALSRERAEAVASHLRSRGYRGRITVVGEGERRPLRVDDPGRYSDEELFRLYRRVEVQR